MDTDWQQQIALGAPMSIFGIVSGRVGDWLSNIPEPMKSILFYGGVTLFFVGVAFGVYGLRKNKKTKRAERKHDIMNAMIFGGLGAILTFIMSPLYSWFSPYATFEGVGGEVWSPIILLIGLAFIVAGVVSYIKR